MPTKPSKQLETFVNPNPERDYLIRITVPEFTCLCPKTGQPDFAVLYFEYIADQKCVELKSLKQYVWSFRNEGAFHEAVTNQILSDLVAATAPRYMQLRAEFNVRGGIYTSVVVEHRKPGWGGSPLARAEPGARTEPAARPDPTRPTTRARTPNARERTTGSEGESGGSEPEPGALYVGIDLGTSGCRALAIDAKGNIVAQAAAPLAGPLRNDNEVTQDPTLWWRAVTEALRSLFAQADPARVRALAVDGTSGTLLLTDAQGTPVTPALLYDDARAQDQAERIAAANPKSPANGASSALAKLLWLHERKMDAKAAHALHPADWIAGRVSGVWGVSDYNNCLKLGYDVERLAWPAWFKSLGVPEKLLPRVVAPGTPIGHVNGDMVALFGVRPDTQVLAGTTDGVAGFIAAGAREPGHAVTSLGSTLILKVLSPRAVVAPEYGVYSHRLGRHWLAGGASNAGGAVLLRYFTVPQMRELTRELNPDEPTGLNYYPLPGIGERFPTNDPNLPPKLEPLPGDSATFFQGMLEGLTRIEADGYALLTRLGAPNVGTVLTTGGGADNPAWQRLRERALQVPIRKAGVGVAAYGTALIAAGRADALAGEPGSRH